MTNYPFESIETFNDVAVVNEYNIVKSQGGNVEALLHKHKMENRDNSRTPMQWDDSTNAGFSEHKPWFPVNPNYTTINVAQQQQDKDSILNFYKQLIQLKNLMNYSHMASLNWLMKITLMCLLIQELIIIKSYCHW